MCWEGLNYLIVRIMIQKARSNEVMARSLTFTLKSCGESAKIVNLCEIFVIST